MSSVELYTKYARVWIPDEENVWIGATVQKDYQEGDGNLKLLLDPLEGEEEGDEKDYKLPKSGLPPLRNPDILVGENDLTSLSYLHEPAVLHNLQIRFVERNQIYTYCGIVLVAINPYEELDIYSNDFIQLYSGHNMGEMDPHIFAIAEEAFKQMNRDEKNQSIIVTGESGAGKTVSAKYAMRYFATVGGSNTESTIEKKVLASNPIMEAIGNAKTIRNDNSSRFGKYIQISFNKRQQIVGANMRTYLLEKSRVVSQGDNERNYHIFYQMCSCSHLPQFQPLKLLPAEQFAYTRIGDCIEIEGVDDQKEFQETVHALTLLGVSTKYQSLIFRILSAILHMGNVDIQEKETNDSCFVDVSDTHLVTMCSLLGIEASQMAKWFCHRKLTTMNEVVVTSLTIDQAVGSRDALAKHIYSKLFDWIVEKINRALVTSEKEHSFIGVLDIYGFETFETNSFEQFCINYANEKLQQQFCQHVFKLEQEEYVREKIDWKFIDYNDNQPCIDLIEKKLGILDLLDDECRMPRGSDASWAQKLYDKHLKTSIHFLKPRMSNSAFIVVHFADSVRYEVDGFLEKNRDTVHEEQLNILKASQKYELVAELFVDKTEKASPIKAGVGKKGAKMVKASITPAKKAPGKRGKDMKRTVGSQFHDSLGKLMTTLNSTTPHYVRCIKPNDYKEAFTFAPTRAVQQLRACGVLETIRISAAGYPSRWTYSEFTHRYRMLMHSKEIVRGNDRKTCENVLSRIIPAPDKYQPGKTKIFFRAGQVAYLEKLRTDKLRACAIMVQKQIRTWLLRKRYLRMRNAALVLQRYARGMQARRRTHFIRRTKAATKIQTAWRRYIARAYYVRVVRAAVCIQSYARGMHARKIYHGMLENAKATIIQACIRGYLARLAHYKQVKAVVLLQCCVRRMIAKRQLKKLKIEARSVDHFKKLNIGMENKIIELQTKLNSANKENKSLTSQTAELSRLQSEMGELEKIKQELVVMTKRATSLQDEVDRLKHERKTNEEESKIMKDAMEKEIKSKDEIIMRLQQESEDIKEEFQSSEEIAMQNLLEVEKSYEEELTKLRTSLEAELARERENNQIRIKEYNRLEQRYDNLKDELEVVRSEQMHSIVSSHSAVTLDNSSPPDTAYNSLNTNTLTSDNEEGEVQPVNLLAASQRKVRELEKEKRELQERILGKMEQGDKRQTHDDYSTLIKLEETLTEKEKLQKELTNLRTSIADSASENLSKDGKAFQEMVRQLSALNEEVEVRRVESIELKTKLAVQNDQINIKEAMQHKNTMTSPELLGFRNRMEDIQVEKLEKVELKAVLAKVYDYNRMLEAEIEAERKNHDVEMDRMQATRPFTNGTIEGNAQHEIMRLSSENINLLSRNEILDKQNKKLKRQLKLYSKKLNMKEADIKNTLLRSSESAMVLSSTRTDEDGFHGPSLKHKDLQCVGMLQYNPGDEHRIVKVLIADMHPRSLTSVNISPVLPAHLMFMLLRFADHRNDDSMIKNLLTQIISGIKAIEKKHRGEVEYLSFWLANSSQMLLDMKQYSGDEAYLEQCTETQQLHSLRNFDLSEYRQVFEDIAVSHFQKFALLIIHEIKPMIVPAMLEHDSIQGLSSSVKPSGMRGRTSSRSGEAELSEYTVDTIIKQLTKYLLMMTQHGMQKALIQQLFKQVFYGIAAETLNNQLCRKEMCNWSKAMQIRYNVSQLEDWLRKSDHDLNSSGARETLGPLVQVSQLLQVKKQSASDADEICKMCTKLTPTQVVKLLKMITPTNDYEEFVSVKFIKMVKDKLQHLRPTTQQSQPLLMDIKYMFGVNFPFVPSMLELDKISIPDVFSPLPAVLI